MKIQCLIYAGLICSLAACSSPQECVQKPESKECMEAQDLQSNPGESGGSQDSPSNPGESNGGINETLGGVMAQPEPVMDECSAGLPWLTVPVRIHLLESNISTLNATLSSSDMTQIMQEVSTYWEQACIRFSIEMIVKNAITLEQETQYQMRIDNGPMRGEHLRIMTDVMPTENRLDSGWNLMVFPKFSAPASGVYLAESQTVLWSEDPPPGTPIERNPSIILAHEFGHSFGLPHYRGSNLTNNLMNEDILQTRNQADQLTSDQIVQARNQVDLGQPTPTPPN